MKNKVKLSLLLGLLTFSHISLAEVAVTHTFTNGGVIDAEQINQNFSDVTTGVNSAISNVPSMPVLKDENDVFVGYFLTSIFKSTQDNMSGSSFSSLYNSRHYFMTSTGFVGVYINNEIHSERIIRFDTSGIFTSTADSIIYSYHITSDCSDSGYLKYNEAGMGESGIILREINPSDPPDTRKYVYVLRTSLPILNTYVRRKNISSASCEVFNDSFNGYELHVNDESITGLSDLVAGGIHFSIQ